MKKLKEDANAPIWPLQSLEFYYEEFPFMSRMARCKIQVIKNQYPYYRKVRGDGNCFYRAFIYSFLEQKIIKGKEALKNFIEFLQTVVLEKKYEKIKNACIYNLKEIERSVEKMGGVLFSLKFLLDRFLYSEFDINMILLTRVLIANHLLNNPEEKIQGISISGIAEACGMKLADYVNSVVLKMGEDARDLVLMITPIVFNVNLKIVVLKMDDDTSGESADETYSSIVDPLTGSVRIDEEKEHVAVLLKPGHYDILLSSHLLFRIAPKDLVSALLFYDNDPFYSKYLEHPIVKETIKSCSFTTSCCNYWTNKRIYNEFVKELNNYYHIKYMDLFIIQVYLIY